LKFRRLYDRLFSPASRPSLLPDHPPVNARGITDTIRGALAAAGLTARSGLVERITGTIEQALTSAGLGDRGGPRSVHQPDAVDARSEPRVDAPSPPRVDEPTAPGEFVTRSFNGDAGTRTYKLYVPSSCEPGQPRMPLLIMLHGCTQNPDDFATGTRMNALAEQHGFIVAYPEQPASANASRCWNWFRAQDQARDSGEPALIAGITREIVATHPVDERRIFVAGLSAGAAMAVILAATHPELYAAVGVHSGLPYGSAHDMVSAFAAMRGRAQGGLTRTGQEDGPRAALPALPAIIFHGDRDATVDASNADAIVAQVRAMQHDGGTLHERVERGETGGRAYTRTVLADGANPPLVEQWTLHGSGHAWSGGDSAGSFTDDSGPDASAQMIRFFLSQRRAGNA
jgi:poly(hydroxyalkanoate) depolymerase family esterase